MTVGAFVRRDLRAAASSRASLVLELAGQLLLLGLLLGLADLVGDDARLAGGYVSFALVGICAARLLQSAASAATQVRTEQTTGTLEVLLLSPHPVWRLVVGLMAYDVARSVLAAASLLAIGVLLTPARLQVTVLLAVLGAACLLALALAAGLALGGLVLVVKGAGRLATAAMSALALLSGAYYPTASLPGHLASIGGALPTAWVFDVLRAGLLGAPVPTATVLAAVAAAVLALPLGALAAELAVRRAVRTGTLSQF